jgi:hypothetical protein
MAIGSGVWLCRHRHLDPKHRTYEVNIIGATFLFGPTASMLQENELLSNSTKGHKARTVIKQARIQDIEYTTPRTKHNGITVWTRSNLAIIDS